MFSLQREHQPEMVLPNEIELNEQKRWICFAFIESILFE